jgi:hypothetical protein
LIYTDDTDRKENREIRKDERQKHKETQARGGSAMMGMQSSRNMARYPMVLKDYDFAAKFVPRASYNEQALVYSELLACGAHSSRENAAFGLKDRTQ